ncbi:MAG: LUD domain-containing protein [Pirellulaceae bacterium]
MGTEQGATDPQYLTEAARQHLREKFLAAEAGLTGVNFAIAETGGIVVCTNEGNADLGVSLPKLHIACMGIEKLIPRLEDLEPLPGCWLAARRGNRSRLTRPTSMGLVTAANCTSSWSTRDAARSWGPRSFASAALHRCAPA